MGTWRPSRETQQAAFRPETTLPTAPPGLLSKGGRCSHVVTVLALDGSPHLGSGLDSFRRSPGWPRLCQERCGARDRGWPPSQLQLAQAPGGRDPRDPQHTAPGRLPARQCWQWTEPPGQGAAATPQRSTTGLPEPQPRSSPQGPAWLGGRAQPRWGAPGWAQTHPQPGCPQAFRGSPQSRAALLDQADF